MCNLLTQVTYTNPESKENIIRKFSVVHHYGDLQAAVEQCFPGHDCVLKVDGTDEVVGNQAEYKFAMSDNIASAPVLKLKVQIFPSQIRKKRKRKVDVDDSLNVTREFRPNLRSGVWENGEITLFEQGVQRYGWSKWSLIAQFIQTRSRKQVKNFSETAVGIRFKPNDISLSYINLAAGFKICAEQLQAYNPTSVGIRENERQIEDESESEQEQLSEVRSDTVSAVSGES